MILTFNLKCQGHILFPMFDCMVVHVKTKARMVTLNSENGNFCLIFANHSFGDNYIVIHSYLLLDLYTEHLCRISSS